MAKITSSVFGKEKVTLTGREKEEAERLARGELRRCPSCGTVLDSAAAECTRCKVGIDPGTGVMVDRGPRERLSDDELAARLRDQGKKNRTGGYMLFFGLVLFLIGVVILMFTGNPAAGGVIAVVGLVPLVAGGSMASKAQKAIKEDVGDNLVRTALDQVFDDVNYVVTGRIPDETLKQAGLVPYNWDRSRGGDYVRASYKGLGIEMSDIILIQVIEKEDSEGNKTYEEHKLFEGLWLICDFGRELSADLRLQERRQAKGLFGKARQARSDVETDSTAFNEKFVILSENPHEVFYILTPHMMECILQADERADGDSYLKFGRDGKVHIAVNSGRNAFEANLGKNVADLEGMRRRFVSEVRYITDIIDELRLVDTLYRK